MKSFIFLISFSAIVMSFTPPSKISLMWGPIINFDNTNTAVCNKKMLQLAIPDPIQLYIDNQEIQIQSAHIEMITSYGTVVNYEMHDGLIPSTFKSDIQKFKGQGAIIYIENITANTIVAIPDFTIKMRSL
jgi:hypothetical protein